MTASAVRPQNWAGSDLEVGDANDALHPGGDSPAYYDACDIPHGAVTRHVYHSRVTSGEREPYVYGQPYQVLQDGKAGLTGRIWPLP